MLVVLDISFYAGTACYVVAALLALGHFWGLGNRPLTWAYRLLVAGAVCFVATLVLRSIGWGRLPLTTVTDALCLFTLFVTATILWSIRKDRVDTLLCFHLPPLAAIGLVNAAVAHRYLHEPPRELRCIPLVLHVGLAFLAYSLFFLASTTSLAYIFESKRLKGHRGTGRRHRLPSLEQLDQALWRLIKYGYPLFAVTLLVGLAWAWVDRDLLGPRWWLSAKVLTSWLMAVFYAATFHIRRSGRLRGPKLAYLVLSGFVLLLLTYLAHALTKVNANSFWSSSA